MTKKSYASAALQQELDRIKNDCQAPNPHQITLALDSRCLYGPEVDSTLGGREPMVDEWESGKRIPTFEQIMALAYLTEYPILFFYEPDSPDFGPVLLCGADGCEIVHREDFWGDSSLASIISLSGRRNLKRQKEGTLND